MNKKIIISLIAVLLLIIAGGFFWWWQDQAEVRELNKNLPEGVRVILTGVRPLEKAEEEKLTGVRPLEKTEMGQEIGREIEQMRPESESKPELTQEQKLAQIQKMLDDIVERIDILSQKIEKTQNQRLARQRNEKEEKEEIEEAEEQKEETREERKEDEVCRVNINTASREKLQKITGIGSALAQRIIEDRPFYSLNDLVKVRGIGSITLQRIIAQGCAYIEGFYLARGGIAGAGAPAPAPATLSEPIPDTTLPKILISEVTVGWDKAANEFIELYNPNDSDVFLSDTNFKLKLVDSSNKITTKRITWIRNIIPAQRYFLLVGGKIEGIVADATFSAQLTSVSGVIITDGNNNIKDRVSWGEICDKDCEGKLPPLEAVEGIGVALEKGLKTGQSIGRQWSMTTQIYIDTDNNQNDFKIQTPTPKVQNQSSEQEAQELEPVQNLLLNEFFEEWELENSKIDYWKPTHWTGSHSFKNNWFQNTDALVGEYSVRVGSSAERTLIQDGLVVEKTTYEAAVYLKGGGQARVAILMGATGHVAYGSWTTINENEWTRVAHTRSISAGSLGGIRIQTENEANILIGAAWLNTNKPPENWPFQQNNF